MTSRAANQTKTEPFPASATEAEAETPGEHPSETPPVRGAEGDVGDAATVPVNADHPAPGSSEQAPVDQGLPGTDVVENDTRS